MKNNNSGKTHILIASTMFLIIPCLIALAGGSRYSSGGSSGDRVTFASTPALENMDSNGYTFATWIQVNSYSAAGRFIWTKSCQVASPCTLNLHEMTVQSVSGEERIYYTRRHAKSTGFQRWWSNISPSGELHHLCFTKSDNTGTPTVNMYVDGRSTAPAGTAIGSGTALDDAANQLQFFGKEDGLNSMQGGLAYPVFIRRVLTQNECIELMHNPLAFQHEASILVPMWGSDYPEIDLSSNSLTGVVTGTTELNTSPPVMLGGGSY